MTPSAEQQGLVAGAGARGGGWPSARPLPPPAAPAPRRLALAVWPAPAPAHPAKAAYMPARMVVKPPPKTKFQKRKEKLVAALRPPYFILSMVIIMTGVHAWGGAEARAALEWTPGGWRGSPWRLLTYGWVHAGAAHVALNALVALAVGWRLEREQGWWRAAALWAAGVAAGALGAAAAQPRVRVVGASAAVYALLTAHIPNVCLRFGHIPLWWFRPLSVAVLAASEAAWAQLRPADAREAVAWAAHLAGAAAGLPVAFLVFTGENVERRYVWWCRAASRAALAAAGGAGALYLLHCAGAPAAAAPR